MSEPRNTKPEIRAVKGSRRQKAYLATRHVSKDNNIDEEDLSRIRSNARNFLLEEAAAEDEEQEENIFNKKVDMFNLDGTRRGLIDEKSYVAPSAYVSPTARILGGSTILDDARVEDFAVVMGATLKNKSLVRDNAFIGPNSILEDQARVIEDGTVTGAVLKDLSLVAENGYIDGKDSTVELWDEVIIKGFAKVLGDTALKGKMIVSGEYEFEDAGTVESNRFFVDYPYAEKKPQAVEPPSSDVGSTQDDS